MINSLKKEHLQNIKNVQNTYKKHVEIKI